MIWSYVISSADLYGGSLQKWRTNTQNKEVERKYTELNHSPHRCRVAALPPQASSCVSVAAKQHWGEDSELENRLSRHSNLDRFQCPTYSCSNSSALAWVCALISHKRWRHPKHTPHVFTTVLYQCTISLDCFYRFYAPAGWPTRASKPVKIDTKISAICATVS